MKLSGILILFVFFCTKTSVAQSRYSVSGNVFGANRQQVAVYARLLALPDSTLLQGAPFEDGRITSPASTANR